VPFAVALDVAVKDPKEELSPGFPTTGVLFVVIFT
jgi:hypothetical protein